LLAGVSAPQGHFDGGTRVQGIVASKDKRLKFWPVVNIQFPGVDNIAGLRFRLRKTGPIVFHGSEVFGMVVVHRCDDERLGVIKRQRAV
jgi:hypothetical protein